VKVLSKEEIILWCDEHKIELDDRNRPTLFDVAEKFIIPMDTGQRVYLANWRMDGFRGESPLLVWFTEWSVWQSGERMHIFDRFRLSYGETRDLSDARAHVFEKDEIEDAISFVTLGILFLWDCYVVTPERKKLLFFSHDEFGLSKGLPSSE